MDGRDDKVRARAYDIWERQGRTGDPTDHWLEAERELASTETFAEDAPEGNDATVDGASPAQAADAAAAASPRTSRTKRTSRDAGAKSAKR